MTCCKPVDVQPLQQLKRGAYELTAIPLSDGTQNVARRRYLMRRQRGLLTKQLAIQDARRYSAWTNRCLRPEPHERETKNAQRVHSCVHCIEGVVGAELCSTSLTSCLLLRKSVSQHRRLQSGLPAHLHKPTSKPSTHTTEFDFHGVMRHEPLTYQTQSAARHLPSPNLVSAVIELYRSQVALPLSGAVPISIGVAT